MNPPLEPVCWTPKLCKITSSMVSVCPRGVRTVLIRSRWIFGVFSSIVSPRTSGRLNSSYRGERIQQRIRLLINHPYLRASFIEHFYLFIFWTSVILWTCLCWVPINPMPGTGDSNRQDNMFSAFVIFTFFFLWSHLPWHMQMPPLLQTFPRLNPASPSSWHWLLVKC